MKVIIPDRMKAVPDEPAPEVTKIESLPDQTVFHVTNGQVLRVGVALEKLQRMLNCLASEGIPGIDLSQPPATQPDIFYYPFVVRPVWDVVWRIVRSHRKIQRAFRGHPALEAIVHLGYDELRQLPLRAYVSGPFGLYIGHHFNFVSREEDRTLADGANEYRCDFLEGKHRTRVSINVQTGSVEVEQDRLA